MSKDKNSERYLKQVEKTAREQREAILKNARDAWKIYDKEDED